MNIKEFVQKFPNEEECKLHFKKTREKEGISCKKCGCKKHYWLKGVWQWQCSSCDFRTTLRSGTFMQGSKLPFEKWYLAMFFMTLTKKGISAKELQRQLSHSRYESIWNMMHKIREAMGERDNLYTLEDMIEFDEGHFEVATKRSTKLKRGKGSQKQQNVAVMAESIPLENNGKFSQQCRYFKMKVLGSHKKEIVNNIIETCTNKQTIVFTDGSKSYVDISTLVEAHVVEVNQNNKNQSLKWVHTAISNAKRTFLGVYHMMKAKYLQNYLNEFCYKLNRRYFGKKLFDRLVIAMAHQYC